MLKEREEKVNINPPIIILHLYRKEESRKPLIDFRNGKRDMVSQATPMMRTSRTLWMPVESRSLPLARSPKSQVWMSTVKSNESLSR